MVLSGYLSIFCLIFGLLLAKYQQTTAKNMMATWKLTLSGQGRYLCPNFSDSSSFRIIRARSQLDCARKCKENPDCLYHSYHKDNGTCQHGLNGSLPTSLTSSSDCQLMVDVKAFEGCNPQASPSGTCYMPFQYRNVQYYQCASINESSKCMATNGQLIDCIAPEGFTAAQEITTLELNQTNVPLPCISNWIVLLSRYNGVVDFNRNWADYKKGFGDLLTSEFWIGNDNIHLITSQPSVTYRLRVEAQTSLRWYYAEYSPFTVESESNGYRIHLSGFQGNAGDSMTFTTPKWNINGMKFSTYDVDNDYYFISCAADYGAGWWFNGCFSSCITCKISTQAFMWGTMDQRGTENTTRLIAARMMTMTIK